MKKEAIGRFEKNLMNEQIWKFQKSIDDTISVLETQIHDLRKRVITEDMSKEDLMVLFVEQSQVKDAICKYEKVRKMLADVRFDISWLPIVEQEDKELQRV